jgi:hypothetical protein
MAERSRPSIGGRNGRALLAGVITFLGALLLIPACSPAELAQSDCIILVSGNKLCGDDARAWCAATDDLRTPDPTLGYKGDPESQKVCDSIR